MSALNVKKFASILKVNASYFLVGSGGRNSLKPTGWVICWCDACPLFSVGRGKMVSS